MQESPELRSVVEGYYAAAMEGNADWSRRRCRTATQPWRSAPTPPSGGRAAPPSGGCGSIGVPNRDAIGMELPTG